MTIHHKLTQAAHRLEGQPMFQLLDRVKKLEMDGKSIIHFEIGDSDFYTPVKIVESAVASLNNGETHYSSSFGLLDLRKAIAQHTKLDLGFKPSINQVLVSPGANSLIYFVIQCLVKPGEEVIVPDPAFSTYYSVLKFLNLKAVRVPLREKNGFRMDPADIRRCVTSKTKLIIINSPHNPTGSVMTKTEVEDVFAIAKEHDLFILSDEIYRLMTYQSKVPSVSQYDYCRERTIVITGFSKSFAMTGWRLGYMVGPEELVEKVSLLLQTIVSCVPAFIQRAGIAALKETRPEVASMVAELKARREIMVHGLNQLPGVICRKPEGAFYVFPNIRNTGMTSSEFAETMLEEAGVALLPGPNFGEYGEGYVRLCYATSIDQINEGLSRIKEVLARNSAVKIFNMPISEL